jgi:23S rRNA (pseudouridine1915-N3)-methyltransferase
MIMETLAKTKDRIILLDERWASLSTSALVETIERAKNESEDITFIIGGSYGVDLELFGNIPHRTIKISDFIMPHSLALLVLVEQVYRAHEIIKGSGYHHS